MRRLLVPSLVAAAAGFLALSANGQTPDEEFGVLKTSTAPAPARPVPSTPLPAGVQPARNTAAPPNPYPLPADAGAWLICAAAYTGPDGAELARQVCEYLRKGGDRFQPLAAYIYNRGAEERKKQEEEWQRMQQANPNVPLRKKGVRIADHYAVLVSGWPDSESAGKYLPVIRKLPVPELKLEGGKCPYELMTYQEPDPQTKKMVVKQLRVSPFHNAMVTRNPLAPPQAVAKQKFDPMWTKLNEDEEYSLLKCKGKLTLVVKEYTGTREMKPRSVGGAFMDALGLGDKGEGLAAAAVQAHELAKFLRNPKLGFKAFVFHMRGSSVVTVGEFAGMDDPELARTQRALASMRFRAQQSGADPIGLLPQPLPVEVPRP